MRETTENRIKEIFNALNEHKIAIAFNLHIK